MDLKHIYDQIVALFAPHLQEREIKDVTAWDGSASQFDSTEDYCNACLINVNAAAGRDDPNDWTQSHCMLPVREPGDASDVFVRQAIYAVAGGRGLGAVVRPDDVPVEAWDAAVLKAANAVITAYEQMDSVAPDGIFEIAGREPPEERAISWGAVYTQVDAQTWPQGFYLHDIYTDDDGNTYAIASQEGKLFRIGVTILDDDVMLGDWERVEVQHVPVQARGLIVREIEGQYRWAGVACTAVLNKDEEIDSSVLFERFEERFNQQDREASPVLLDFWHQDVFLGTVDYVAADGYTLVASGTFRNDEIGRAAAETISAEPNLWGQSIAYTPLAAPGYLEVGNGISFPVWEDGRLERVALLPSDRAAAWYTTFNTRSREMRTDILEALKKLVGADNAEALATQADGINARVSAEGLIAREETTGEEVPESPAAEPEPVEEQEPAVSADVQMIRDLRSSQQAIQAQLNTLVTAINEFVPEIDRRLEALEGSEQERREAWLSDLPAPQPRNVVRPRQTAPTTTDKVDSSERVNRLLAEKHIIPTG